MTLADIVGYSMGLAGCCYVVASVAYILDGKTWIGVTVGLYAMTIYTIWRGATH